MSLPPAPPPQTAGSTPKFYPQSVSFISGRDGWALGPAWLPGSGPSRGDWANAPAVLAATHDSGATWKVVSTPSIPYLTGVGSYDEQVWFSDASHGYLFGNSATVYLTADAGLHWSSWAAPSPVVDVAAVSGHVYALVASCPKDSPGCGQSTLDTVTGSGAFVPVTGVPVLNYAQLVTHGSQLYATSTGKGPNALVQPSMWSTSNAATWTRQPLPSLCEFSIGLAAFSPQGLALACGGNPGAGQQMKTAYVSTDGGRHWVARGAIPTGGYVGELAATDASHWIDALGRGDLVATQNGGATWTQVPLPPQAQQALGDGWLQIVLQPDGHGAATSLDLIPDLLLLTSDGGRTWTEHDFTPIPVPGATTQPSG